MISNELFLVGYPIFFEHALIIESIGDFFLVMGIQNHHPAEKNKIEGNHFSPNIEDPSALFVVKDVLKKSHFTEK